MNKEALIRYWRLACRDPRYRTDYRESSESRFIWLLSTTKPLVLYKMCVASKNDFGVIQFGSIREILTVTEYLDLAKLWDDTNNGDWRTEEERILIYEFEDEETT